jgi:hypothetical protein
MESRNKQKSYTNPVIQFLNSRPDYLPVYGKFKVKSKKDKDIQKLLKLENWTTKKTIRLLRKRGKLIKRLKAVDGHIYANCCTIYTYWLQNKKGLLQKK